VTLDGESRGDGDIVRQGFADASFRAGGQWASRLRSRGMARSNLANDPRARRPRLSFSGRAEPEETRRKARQKPDGKQTISRR